MDFTSQKTSPNSSEIIYIPFWKGKEAKVEEACDNSSFKNEYNAPIKVGDFKGKEGEILILYPSKGIRIGLVGLGEKDKITTEKLRRIYSNVTKSAINKKIKEITVLVPKISHLLEEATINGISEGLLLANYHYLLLKNDSIKEEKPTLVQVVHLIGASKKQLSLAQKNQVVAQAVYFTRDLVNGNADDITPQHLCEVAKDLAKDYPKIKTKILDKKQIEKEKMGLILAVNKGSPRDPALILMEYRGNPKSKELTAIVGKGITFDTGGLNLKPHGSMDTMKCDMGGAGVVFGTMKALASLGLKVNVIGVVPTTENSIDGNSYKPGDVYKSFLGKTIEIVDTDAEGRLVLADALAYTVQNYKPSQIIDFATLTGAIQIALGSEASGLFSNNDALANSLMRSGSETFERLWRMPMYEEYRDLLKSDIADMKNVGGRPGGAISAAHFLQEFVNKTPWAHCDIAATAFLSEGKRYLPKYATGVGVRLMTDFFENL
ncbi:Cytosol aminopeptidase [Candidatus Rubidus massiliensis]|nr:Cytosol aminopeptidase [Candidatus Rubidus massiliensis]